MNDAAPMLVLIAVAVASEWKNYRTASSADRWFAAALYAGAAAIWLWMAGSPDLPRPGNWLDTMFR